MDEIPQGLLLFGVIFLVLLFVAVLAATLVYLGRSQNRRRAQTRRNADEAVRTPAVRTPAVRTPAVRTPAVKTPAVKTPAMQAPAASETQPPEVKQPAQPGEEMRVIRDEQTSQVVIEVAGQRYTHIRQIQDARIGRRVLLTIADLVRFTGGMATNPQAVRTAIASDTAPETRAATPESPSPSPSAQDIPSLTLPAAPATLPSTLGQQRGLIAYIRRGLEAPESAQPLPNPTAFVDEIEAILQQHIRARSSPLQVPVHVLSGEDGMLQIRVGINTYNSADEIPDAEIRQMIRTAVRAWEQS